MGQRKFVQSKTIWLIILLIAGFLLRWAFLQENLFFSFEQGRDLLILKEEISKGDLKLIGPRTNIDGVFHGPLFYYLMLPFYLVSGGHPLAAVLPFILLGTTSIYLVYLIGRDFFNQRVGMIGALLYAFSYKAIVLSRWLSNPPPAAFFSLLFFYSLYRWVKGNERFLILTIIAFAGVFHSEAAAAIFLFPALLIVIFLFKPVFKKKLFGLLAFLLSFSTYILFELRYQFLLTKSIWRFLSTKGSVYRASLQETLPIIFERYVGEFQLMVLPINIWLASLILIGVFIVLLSQIKKTGSKILFLWLLSAPPLALFIWGGFHLPYYMLAVGPGMVIGAAFLIDWLMRQKKWQFLARILLLVCLLSNLYAWLVWLPANQRVFYVEAHPYGLFGQEKTVVDYIYQDAGDQEFSYRAFTIPYSMEHAWEYLFKWYGQKQYHYLSAHAHNQSGLFYLIQEPGGDQLYKDNWKKEVVGSQKPLKTEEFNGIIIESYYKDEKISN